MNKLLFALMLLSPAASFAGNCDYNANEIEELMPKTIQALELKGYTLSTDPQASFHLVAGTSSITYNPQEDPIFIVWDIEGGAYFKNKSKKLDIHNVPLFDSDKKNYASTALRQYKVYFFSKNSEARAEAAAEKAYETLDKRISNQVRRRLVHCEN